MRIASLVHNRSFPSLLSSRKLKSLYQVLNFDKGFLIVWNLKALEFLNVTCTYHSAQHSPIS